MHRRKVLPVALLLLAALAAGAPAAGAGAAGIPTAVDPVVVRINAPGALTGQARPRPGAPVVVTAPDQVVSRGQGLDYQVAVAGLAVRLPGPEHQVVTWDFPGRGAPCGSPVHARVEFPLVPGAPAGARPEVTATLQVRGAAGTGSVPLRGTGLAADLYLTPAVADRSLTLRLDCFGVEPGPLAAGDLGPVQRLLDAGVPLPALFDVAGCVTSLGRCLERVTAARLRKSPGLQAALHAGVEQAFRDLWQPQAAGAPAPPFGPAVALDAELLGLAATGGRLTAHWRVDAPPGEEDGAPGLAYAYQARPAENPGAQPPRGDVDVYIPLSLLDRVAYAAARAGAFPRQFHAVYAGIRFQGTATPHGQIRSTATAGAPGVVTLEVPVRLALAGYDAAGAPLIESEQAGGILRVQAEVRASGGNGLALVLPSATVAGLTGTVRVLGQAVPLAQLQAALDQGLGARVPYSVPWLPLLPAVWPALPPSGLVPGDVAVGSMYLRVPLHLMPPGNGYRRSYLLAPYPQ